MTRMKMTLSELREHITNELRESVNFWDQHYHYNPRTDSIDDLVQGAMKWYGFARASMGLESPADPKFLKKLQGRMSFLGISDDVIEKVIFKLRLQRASSTNLKPVK